MISVYAHGPAQIEVGKFNGSLPQAIAWFHTQVEKFDLKVDVTTDGTTARFSIKGHDFGAWAKLLHEVANVSDLRGDAPDVYYLYDDCVLVYEGYTKTGVYSD